MEKALLNLKEFCQYLGIGETKARELLTKTNNNYTVRIGNRLYANKIMLDRWLLNNSGNQFKKQNKTQMYRKIPEKRMHNQRIEHGEDEQDTVIGMIM